MCIHSIFAFLIFQDKCAYFESDDTCHHQHKMSISLCLYTVVLCTFAAVSVIQAVTDANNLLFSHLLPSSRLFLTHDLDMNSLEVGHLFIFFLFQNPPLPVLLQVFLQWGGGQNPTDMHIIRERDLPKITYFEVMSHEKCSQSDITWRYATSGNHLNYSAYHSQQASPKCAPSASNDAGFEKENADTLLQMFGELMTTYRWKAAM